METGPYLQWPLDLSYNTLSQILFFSSFFLYRFIPPEIKLTDKFHKNKSLATSFYRWSRRKNLNKVYSQGVISYWEKKVNEKPQRKAPIWYRTSDSKIIYAISVRSPVASETTKHVNHPWNTYDSHVNSQCNIALVLLWNLISHHLWHAAILTRTTRLYNSILTKYI